VRYMTLASRQIALNREVGNFASLALAVLIARMFAALVADMTADSAPPRSCVFAWEMLNVWGSVVAGMMDIWLQMSFWLAAVIMAVWIPSRAFNLQRTYRILDVPRDKPPFGKALKFAAKRIWAKSDLLAIAWLLTCLVGAFDYIDGRGALLWEIAAAAVVLYGATILAYAAYRPQRTGAAQI
jgi:hypothetical protein